MMLILSLSALVLIGIVLDFLMDGEDPHTQDQDFEDDVNADNDTRVNHGLHRKTKQRSVSYFQRKWNPSDHPAPPVDEDPQLHTQIAHDAPTQNQNTLHAHAPRVLKRTPKDVVRVSDPPLFSDDVPSNGLLSALNLQTRARGPADDSTDVFNDGAPGGGQHTHRSFIERRAPRPPRASGDHAATIPDFDPTREELVLDITLPPEGPIPNVTVQDAPGGLAVLVDGKIHAILAGLNTKNQVRIVTKITHLR